MTAIELGFLATNHFIDAVDEETRRNVTLGRTKTLVEYEAKTLDEAIKLVLQCEAAAKRKRILKTVCYSYDLN